MTACLWQCILPIVKPIEHISLKANQPDKAGELRDGDVRTAFYGAAHLSCPAWSFCAQSIEGKVSMEPVETKNKLEETRELTRGLAAAAVEAAKGLEKTKIVMLASIHFLLGASPDLLDDDIIQELKHTQGWLTKEVSGEDVSMSDKLIGSAEKSESEADAVIEEAVAAPKGLDGAIVASIVKEIEEVLDHTTPEGQVEVMQILADRQPQRFTEYEAEIARDEVRDNLINLVNESSYPAQTKLYEMLTDFIKKSQGELTEAA